MRQRLKVKDNERRLWDGDRTGGGAMGVGIQKLLLRMERHTSNIRWGVRDG